MLNPELFAQSKTVAKTTIRKSNGEFHVRAYDQHNQRMPEADYFTTDKADAVQTAKRMTNAQ